MTNSDSIQSLLALLAECHTFVITSHARPDGDAIGSSVGLMHLLEGMGKQATVALADPIPHVYRFLPGIERVVDRLPAEAPDALVILECDTLERTGFPVSGYGRFRTSVSINVDHHQSGRQFAAFNWIDPEACAVGAMVYELALASGQPITPEVANCLYTAVLTDTGSFTYRATTAATFGLAEHLIECGADANRIAQAIYFSNPASKIRLLGTALSNLQIAGPVAWSSVTLDEIDQAGAIVEDCEGVVNYLIGIEGVEAAVFLRELPDRGEFRLSLRSKAEIDVARVAERFGGGGHRNASGCTVQGSLPLVSGRIVSELQGAVEAEPKTC